MENIDIYEDVSNVDLGSQIYKLEGQNKQLLDHIHKLESDIEKLCSKLVDMKQVQQNLSKNISELFKTAKLEIERKDRTIADLRKEVEDLTFNRGNNRIFKRQRNGSRINSPAKRFKTDPEMVNKKPDIKMLESEINSEPKSVEKVKLENSNDKNLKIVNRNDKSDVNNQCEQNSKTNLHENDFVSNERKGDRFINKLKHNDEFSMRYRSNNKWRDSKSGDRNRGRGRSGSNDRYKRNRSNNRSRRRSRSNERLNSQNKSNVRYNRSSSIERNKCIETTARSSHSRSKDRKFSRSKSKDSRCESYKYRNRSRNRDEGRKSSPKIKNNPKTEKLINETERNTHTPELQENDFIVLDDLEEGEIAPSPLSNKFNKREEKMENPQNYKTENNCEPLPKAEVKSITITEYRNRQKSEAFIIQEESETKIVCNFSEIAIDKPNTPLEINKDHASEVKEQTNTDIEQSRIECETESNKKIEIENPANIIKTFTTDVLNEKKSCNNTSKTQEESSSNNSLNTSNLETSSMSNDSVSTSANNSLNSTGGRNRRRRCVVIGIKNKN